MHTNYFLLMGGGGAFRLALPAGTEASGDVLFGGYRVPLAGSDCKVVGGGLGGAFSGRTEFLGAGLVGNFVGALSSLLLIVFPFIIELFGFLESSVLS